eukprot:228450-Chlamydomonas_euryale.AAC.11
MVNASPVRQLEQPLCAHLSTYCSWPLVQETVHVHDHLRIWFHLRQPEAHCAHRTRPRGDGIGTELSTRLGWGADR